MLPTILCLAAILPAQATAQATAAELLERCRSADWRGGRSSDAREIHCEVREARLPGGSLRVNATTNGGVRVSVHDGSDVIVRSVVLGRAADAARARALVDAVVVQTLGVVSAEGPQAGDREHWSAEFDILVPARIDLDLEVHNGPLTVTGVEGTHRFRARNGPVTLSRLAGDVEARTENGPVNVTLDGRGWAGRGLTAESRNGPLSVRIPESYAARIQGSTRNGPLRSDLPVTTTDARGVSRTIDAEINGGGTTLRFSTENGPLSILRQ
jgi:hypothetical protein